MKNKINSIVLYCDLWNLKKAETTKDIINNVLRWHDQEHDADNDTDEAAALKFDCKWCNGVLDDCKINDCDKDIMKM